MSSSQELNAAAAGLPLAALRTFESFARLGSISAAAAELGITVSAVSYQLSGLENQLGTALTEKRGRILVLNEAGRRFSDAVSPAFLLLQRAAAQLRQEALPERVTVSAQPLLASGWLMPQLAAFMEKHPQVQVQLQYARYRNYASDVADLSLRFGRGVWPGYASEKLLSGKAFPVCSAALAQRHGPFARDADLAALPLVHDGTPEPWAAWLTAAGAPPKAALAGMVCEDGLLTRGAMLEGIGAALTRPVLIAPELASGALVQLSQRGFDSGEDYYLCLRSDREPQPGAAGLAAWLRRAARPVGRGRTRSNQSVPGR
ncbi:LysR substrate-binding domain-containing protein [Xylophilus sp.]|uniref:LysR substrate-binding domain-containing protein n=1 Tax=Xylophilus sp. TaxID=2653893 RepID=UPI0013B698B8|nr:LysR substrate-binding domain-containing protein [Xylophilus sp.]KAF1048376.1 MAG: Glycine cleavage system transcriptional activator [Xylophilus sp.]